MAEFYRITGPKFGDPGLYSPETEKTLLESWRAIRAWAPDTIVSPSGIIEDGKLGKLYNVVAAASNAPVSIRMRTLPVRLPDSWLTPATDIKDYIDLTRDGWKYLETLDGKRMVVKDDPDK
jgi:hypothetical protein